ncbi:MAG: hypothetical protein JSS09_01455 [Verrucomicrobia bacterium]|nr:hypothetical protein [Verrucomicrobiota bacterium]
MNLFTVLFIVVVFVIVFNLYRQVSKTRQQYRLWGEHIFWTRNYLVETFSNRPTNQIVNRLMQNQKDLGGENEKLVGLLQEHIKIASQIVNDIIQGIPIETDLALWQQNAIQIAKELCIPKDDMLIHLDTTAREVQAMAKGDFQCIAESDATLNQGWHMAKMLSM